MTTTTATATPERRRRIGYVVLLGLGVLVALAPFFALTSGYRLDIFRNAMYFAILAATWSLLAGVSGQFSFAHVAIAGLAGYASAIWAQRVAGAIGSIPAGIVFGTLVATALGLGMGLLLLRLRAAYLALFTIAFAEIARLFAVAEIDLTGGRLSLAVEQLPGDELFHHYLMLGLLVAVLIFIYWLLGSRTGLFLRAMREDEEAASAMGVHVVRLKVFVFTLTSALIGFSAAVYTHTIPRLTPDTMTLLAMGIVIAIAVIGGIESPLAAAIGAVIMFMVLENLRRIGLAAGPTYALATLALIGVAVLAWVIWRTRQRAGQEFPEGFWRSLGWLAGATVLGVAASLAGSPVGWILLFVAIGLLAVFVIQTGRARYPGWMEQTLAAFTTGAVLLTLGVVLLAAGVVDVELGVWRFAVFGLVLMLTLRFAYNGLIVPILNYFSGRREAMARTVSLRDQAEAIVEGSGE